MKAQMRVKKNTKLDVAYVQLRRGAVAKTIELRPGILMDLDKNGEVIGIEVLSIAKLAPLFMENSTKKTHRNAS